jgi:hypothetical protein
MKVRANAAVSDTSAMDGSAPVGTSGLNAGRSACADWGVSFAGISQHVP